MHTTMLNSIQHLYPTRAQAVERGPESSSGLRIYDWETRLAPSLALPQPFKKMDGGGNKAALLLPRMRSRV